MLECSHFVANDSGVMNIANALGIPTLALFAPTNARTRLPLRDSSEAIVLEKDCAPCEIKDPKGFARGHCRCMGDIAIEVEGSEIPVWIAEQEIGIDLAAHRRLRSDQKAAPALQRRFTEVLRAAFPAREYLFAGARVLETAIDLVDGINLHLRETLRRLTRLAEQRHRIELAVAWAIDHAVMVAA